MNIINWLLPKSKLYTVELFMDVSGAWRWRIRHQNQNVLATSEAYSSRAEAITTATNLALAARFKLINAVLAEYKI